MLAPTDAAFAKLAPGAVEGLQNPEARHKLRAILSCFRSLPSPSRIRTAATTEDGLLWRKSAHAWVHSGTAEHVAGMTALGNRLFAATRKGGLRTRDL